MPISLLKKQTENQRLGITRWRNASCRLPEKRHACIANSRYGRSVENRLGNDVFTTCPGLAHADGIFPGRPNLLFNEHAFRFFAT